MSQRPVFSHPPTHTHTPHFKRTAFQLVTHQPNHVRFTHTPLRLDRFKGSSVFPRPLNDQGQISWRKVGEFRLFGSHFQITICHWKTEFAALGSKGAERGFNRNRPRASSNRDCSCGSASTKSAKVDPSNSSRITACKPSS